jgi:hypothetical protein
VSLPVRAPLAKKLIAVARPAMFGRGEETLTDTVLECLMPALRSAARSAASRSTAGFDEIARNCARRLDAILARPRREDDDWSIVWTGCRCDLCDTLGAFLGSRSRRTFEWPLAKDGRRHVHAQIDAAGLPVRHQTRRQGRPYTLVLTKTDELFTRARTALHTAETDLVWLTATRDDISARTQGDAGVLDGARGECRGGAGTSVDRRVAARSPDGSASRAR